MTHSSTLVERWTEITEFPGYSVSDGGQVVNNATGQLLKPTKNSHGVLMVGLMKSAVQHKRSLPLLVARAYLPKSKIESFDTPIHLDGNRENVHYNNLMWRPLWFSRKFMRQFSDNHVTYNGPIEDVDTGEAYSNSMHAAMTHGLLDVDIYFGMLNGVYVWPTRQTFRKVVSR